MELKEILGIEDPKERSKAFMSWVLDQVKKGQAKVVLQAKSVCVDARVVGPEEAGKMHTVWCKNKVEVEYELQEGAILITTLGKDGKPELDAGGHDNTYQQTNPAKFAKTYHKHPNGHYAPDQTPVATILINPELIPEAGIELLPPNWGGYTGKLMKGGLVMLPYDPSLTGEQQLAVWESYIKDDASVDWYPNNLAGTYSECNSKGIFKDPELRELFQQGKSKADPEQAD